MVGMLYLVCICNWNIKQLWASFYSNRCV